MLTDGEAVGSHQSPPPPSIQPVVSVDVRTSETATVARAVIASVMAAAPRYFQVLPKTPLEFRAVEIWPEATASTAFYNAPSADGTRPGTPGAKLA